MNRTLVFSVLLLTLAGMPLAAEGAGGVEFLQVVGKDLWPLPGGAGLPSRTGQVSSVGGLGYGVDHEGSVTGGFGLGISSRGLSTPSSPLGEPLKGFSAGYGGTIQGWQHRWGPLVGLFTTRIGFGGAEWVTDPGPDFHTRHSSGFSLLGTAGAQMGLTVLPWFEVAMEAGVAGTVTFTPGEPFIVGYAPTIGMRLLWGSF